MPRLVSSTKIQKQKPPRNRRDVENLLVIVALRRLQTRNLGNGKQEQGTTPLARSVGIVLGL